MKFDVRVLSVALSVAGLALAECAHPQATSRGEPVGEARVTSISEATLPDGNTRITVTQAVRRVCRIPDAAAEAPHFDFDSAQLRARGESILDQVAECAMHGSLMGAKLRIVGRTDPRGSDAYNMELGLARSEGAKNYLMSKGLEDARVLTDSRGERDATGTDEVGWQRDRSIEVDVGAGPTK